MESGFTDPRFLLTAAVVLAGVIFWFARLESRVSDNVKEISRVDQAAEDTWKELDLHRSRADIHFNEQLAAQVERRQAERMGRIEADVKEIKGIVKEIARGQS